MTDTMHGRLAGLVADMPTEREAEYAAHVWTVGRRRRRLAVAGRTTIAGLALASLVWVAAGPLAVPVTRQTDVGSIQNHSTDVSAEDAKLRLAQVQAELAAHPAWPQREIVLEDGLLVLPFGAGDPQDYLAWTVQIGSRYDGAVRRAYVQNSGKASEAELESIKRALSGQLQNFKTLAAYTLAVQYENGRVELMYQQTSDPAFLDFVANAKQTYGDLFHAEQVDDGPTFLPLPTTIPTIPATNR